MKKITDDCTQLKIQTNLVVRLPEIVVCGMQSAGKSSVMDRLAGHRLFPKGDDLVTRMPFRLKLFRRTNDELREMAGRDVSFIIKIMNAGGVMEVPPAEADIAAIIQERMKTLVNGVGMIDREFVLEVYHPDAPNMDLLDLPGLVQVAGQGVHPNVVPMARKIAQKYIEDKNNLVLAVLPCTEVPINNAIWTLIDNEVKKRTIGVLPKVDVLNPLLQQSRTQVIQRIKGIGGEAVSLAPYGYIGLSNGCHLPLKPITEIATTEDSFFKEHYQELTEAKLVGIQNLVEKINEAFVAHINQQVMPSITDELNRLQQVLGNQLATIPVVICRENWNEFQEWVVDSVVGKSELALQAVWDQAAASITTSFPPYNEIKKVMEQPRYFCSSPNAFETFSKEYPVYAVEEFKSLVAVFVETLANVFDSNSLPWTINRFDRIKSQFIEHLTLQLFETDVIIGIEYLANGISESIFFSTSDRIRVLHPRTMVKTLLSGLRYDLPTRVRELLETLDPKVLMETESENIRSERKSIEGLLGNLDEAKISMINLK